jgi:hypothetical protein
MQFDFNDQVKTKTTDQLIEAFLHPENYQPEFNTLAEQELFARGIDLAPYQLKRQQREEYYTSLYKEGKPGTPGWIALFFVASLLGGIAGIIAGIVYSQSKHKHFGDDSYYVFDQKTRNLGIGMILLGTAVIVLYFLSRFTD